jgi:hypothetical protein
MAVAAVPVATGATSGRQVLSIPTGLQSFELRLGDAAQTTPSFSRTPSFAWKPVRGAVRYQFELSTSAGFGADSSVVWSSTSLTSPAAAVPIALPWLAGRPLYWRVRAFGRNGVSPWSAAAGFRMQSVEAPHRVAGGPGYARWSSVPGVTGYQVWLVNANKVVSTATTAVDLRDYHGEKGSREAVWRVRAERRLFGSDRRALPAVSYGPWSEAYTTPIESRTAGPLKTISEGMDVTGPVPAHKLMPVFVFPAKDKARFQHVYVASDSSCKNIVLNSSPVRGSAYVPRSSQVTRTASGDVPVTHSSVATTGGKRIWPSEAGDPSAKDVARVDLPAGQYYWTVVPVERRADGSYHDLMHPEAACRAGKGTFVMGANSPTVGTTDAAFVTGLSPLGRLLSPESAPGRFYGSPLVAWRPSAGATSYEVQWSRSATPWRTVGTTKTYATSATLPLQPGTWWYRVRGIDSSIQGDQRLGWSAPTSITIASPTFAIVG